MNANANSIRRRSEAVQSLSESTIINTTPMLDNPHSPLAIHHNMGRSKAIVVAGVLLNGALATVLTWGLTIGLIIGGCCSNVSKYGRDSKEYI